MPNCLKCGDALTVNEEGVAPVLCDRCAGVATSRARRNMNLSTVYKFPATTTLLVINIAVYLAMLFTSGSFESFSGEELVRWGGNFGPLTISGDYWRLITTGFVHANPLHILFNMWGLWSLGRLAERLFGKWQTALIYLVTGIGGALLSIAYNHERLEVGASGAIFGIAGALLAGIKFGELEMSTAEKRSTFSSLTFVIILNFAMGFGGSIDNMCHLGGFVTGLLVGLPLGAFIRKGWTLQAATLLITLGVIGAGFRELVQTNGTEAMKTAVVVSWKSKNFSKAVHILEKYVVANPNDDVGFVMLGESYEANHQRQRAIEALEQALRVNPN